MPYDATQRQVAVVTDSVAQVPSAKARELHIVVIPFPIIIAGREYRDGVNLPPEELYRRMREEQVLPTTSHPSVTEYAQVFRECLQRGAPAVLYLGLSGQLSGALDVAAGAAQMLRAEFPDKPVVILDTKTAAIPQGFVAMQAARVAEQGAPLDDVVESAQEAREHTGFAAALETLEYLARGGRIGRAENLLGNLLQVKPIVTVESDGIVAPLARPRGNHAALEFIVSFVRERTAASPELHLAVMQADNQAEAAHLRRLAEETMHPAELFLTDFTPVMGAHTGPGVVGLAYYAPIPGRRRGRG